MCVYGCQVTGSKRRALAMITTETSSSQAPKPSSVPDTKLEKLGILTVEWKAGWPICLQRIGNLRNHLQGGAPKRYLSRFITPIATVYGTFRVNGDHKPTQGTYIEWIGATLAFFQGLRFHFIRHAGTHPRADHCSHCNGPGSAEWC